MGLSRAARERGLKAIVSLPLWLGLATERRGNGVVEVADAAYKRMPVTFEADVTHEGMRSVVYNKGSVIFPPFAADAGELRYWFIIDAEKDGTIQAVGNIDPERLIGQDQKAYTLTEAAGIVSRGQKDSWFVPSYPRILAGHEPRWDAGALALFMEAE